MSQNGRDRFTIKTDNQYREDVKEHDSKRRDKVRQNYAFHGFYLQNTSFTTLGMFLEGFLVSPAVIPRLSVPPTAAMHCEGESTEVVITPTGKAGRHKNSRKTSKSAHKRRPSNFPVG
jgi:hypothetical protein